AGLACDGDGDRIGAVDERGEIIWGDKLLALFSREILARGPAKIIFEVKCSQGLVEDIKAHGGEPIMWKTGHSLIKEKMKQENSPLAGEMSGHIFFADNYYGYDDAIFACGRLLQLLSNTQEKLSDLLKDIPSYINTPEIRIPSSDGEKFKIVEKVKDFFKDKYEVIDVDGARILFGDGWGLVRASNTQPVLVLRFEANTEERLKEIQGIVEGKVSLFNKEIK
ncbi:MAG: phosphomannomutase, partial [Candidatus Omnitrophica bacterium]|nr:phosphomannomutase [Candidatus Omnitrophota bacterium]